MINVNLLPDIKMQRVQAAKRQKTIGALSTLAIGIGIALPVFMMVLWGGQKALLSLSQRGIDEKIKQLQAEENLSTILTVQNQMEALPEADKRRLFYNNLLAVLPKVIPQNAALLGIDINDAGTIRISGKADSLATVNDFVNILSAAMLTKGSESKPAFTGVTLINAAPTDTGASFEISFTHDGSLVAKTLDYELSVGGKVLYQPPQSVDNESEEEEEESDATDTSEQPLLPQEQQP